MAKVTPVRPGYSIEEAERRFPGALVKFPGGEIGTYEKVTWSYPNMRSEDPDGILVLPASPDAPGYLYFNGKWRKL